MRFTSIGGLDGLNWSPLLRGSFPRKHVPSAFSLDSGTAVSTSVPASNRVPGFRLTKISAVKAKTRAAVGGRGCLASETGARPPILCA